MVVKIDKPFLFLDIDDTALRYGLVFDATDLESRDRLPEWTEGLIGFDFHWTNAYGGRNVRAYFEPWMVGALHELAQVYDIVWSSAWGGRARDLAKVLDLPYHYCISPQRGDLGNYKGRAIEAFLRGQHTSHYEDGPEAWDLAASLPVEPRVRPFAWADDDTDFDEDLVREWADANGVAMLRVQPAKRVGLTSVQVQQLLAFASEQNCITK